MAEWGALGDDACMVLSSDQPIGLPHGLSVPASSWRWVFSRSSGPGGQNVNKVSTKATLVVELSALEAALPVDAMGRLLEQAKMYLGDGVLQLSCSESRSQLRNREACVEQLYALVLRAMVRPRKRRATKPSKGAVQRRLDTKKHRGQIKRGRMDGGAEK